MAQAPDEQGWEEEAEEGYFVSITDMMIGLLFLFIIMLMYFALQLRTVTQDLTTADDSRSKLLERVAGYMRDHNVKAEVDLEAGVLRLPDDVLFDKGREDPKPSGVAAIQVLADALDANLPCYAFQPGQGRPAGCDDSPHSVEVILIEGHTDSDRLSANGRMRDNWDLSSARASNTFRILSQYKPDLLQYRSGPDSDPSSQTLLSVAGYADQRPVDAADNEQAKGRNRRIDLRFIMSSPKGD
jgi:chemotaxis protein MotB